MASEESEEGPSHATGVVPGYHPEGAYSHCPVSIDHCVHTRSPIVSQWTTTLNEWESDYTSNHAQAFNAFIKGIQGEKNKDSLSFFF